MTKATKQRIIEAAFDALATHGYADLSIKAIGEELGQSPSLIYYHFEDKDDLILALLDFHIEGFTEQYIEGSTADPETKLRQLVEKFLPEEVSADELELLSVYAELRAQAARNDEYREKVTWIDDLLVETVATFIDEGIESGQFQVVESDVVAEHIVALLLHGQYARATTDREDTVPVLRTVVDDLISRDLLGATS
ncbi:TetR/AcrR family transcriptional regulator [Halomarina oriensis]|uniref:TetR family transcriptional regulator n=1 Tax=Halomarina oriensis TaxID=671145 RepID=A0A6B0GL99_9EURY|nr:TetR/AcrR family transcriptional regulator [Halomarina oriensis]MWG34229.1 TetR family transcriptional regulator [Halomarina oriensis]